MRFTFEGRTYVIEFQRDNGLVEIGDGRQSVKRYTSARLLEEVGGQLVLVRGYKVSCSHRDRFTHEAGRKAALTAALYDAPTKGGGEPVLGTPLTKEFRTAVWNAYHSRSK